MLFMHTLPVIQAEQCGTPGCPDTHKNLLMYGNQFPMQDTRPPPYKRFGGLWLGRTTPSEFGLYKASQYHNGAYLDTEKIVF